MQMRLVYDQFAKDHFNSPPPLQGKGSVKAIHYIQSFSPDDDVTPELAHKIAKAFLRKAFGDDVQAVIANHVDKNHLHSHIIINSYSLSGKKYYANRKSLKRIRDISDGVCKAFGIDIHPNLKGKGKSINHKEWEHRKNGTSWKQQIRDEIDKLIPAVNSLDELLQTLEEHGYEIKRGKYISIRAPGQERFVRTKTLGDEYTEDSLNIRIRYREVGAGNTPEQTASSKLQAAYVAIIDDVRILAAQRKKSPCKRIVTAEYSVENDLDVYKLSAQLSVINKDNIKSVGDLQGRIATLRADYEKQRVAVNDLIDEYNNSLADRKKAESLYKRITDQKEKLLQIRQRYDVYCDISKTYGEISKGDYISNLVEEEKQRKAQTNKKKPRR